MKNEKKTETVDLNSISITDLLNAVNKRSGEIETAKAAERACLLDMPASFRTSIFHKEYAPVMTNITNLLLEEGDVDIINIIHALLQYTEYEDRATKACHILRTFFESGIDRSRVNSLDELAEVVKSSPLGTPETSNKIDYTVGEQTYTLNIRPKIKRKTKEEKAAEEAE
jgi:hypothetical protein